jgi:hypothetical protein
MNDKAVMEMRWMKERVKDNLVMYAWNILRKAKEGGHCLKRRNGLPSYYALLFVRCTRVSESVRHPSTVLYFKETLRPFLYTH